MARSPIVFDTVSKSGCKRIAAAPRAGTKQALLVTLLSRDTGASLWELVDELGWNANSVHAAISTLRTRGWLISVNQNADERRYKIVAP
jgi:hypothetical protein